MGIGEVIDGLKLALNALDVSVHVGFRGAGPLSDTMRIQSGDPLPLEAVNVGGSTARFLNITISIPGDVDVTADDNWTEVPPNPEMPDGSTGWKRPLGRLEGKGRRPLPGLRISRTADTWTPPIEQPWTVLMYEVWWEFLWMKKGRGADALEVQIQVEPKKHK